MDVKIHHIIPQSRVDGPGLRAVVFFQGCTLACPGCQSKHLWPAAGGRSVAAEDLAASLALLSARTGNVTLSGGEVFQQPAALAELVGALRRRGVRHITAYTGYTWEELHEPTHPAAPYLDAILAGLDVLVDGRFVRALDDDHITWRGSRNQRPIDVPATLAAGRLVVLDWDSDRIIITEEGELILPAGLAGMLSGLGQVEHAPMCGSTRR